MARIANSGDFASLSRPAPRRQKQEEKLLQHLAAGLHISVLGIEIKRGHLHEALNLQSLRLAEMLAVQHPF